MRWSIFPFKSSRFSCMSRRISVCAGEAVCGTINQKSDVTVQRWSLGLSTAESRLRSLRGRSRSYDRRSENMLLPPYRNHVTSSDNSNQPRRFAATDSKPNRPGGYLILRAKKLLGGLPGAVFLTLEPQCTMFARVASSEECRLLPESEHYRLPHDRRACRPQ